MRLTFAALFAVTTALAGCSSGNAAAVDSTGMVCDEFAAYAKAGQPAGQRDAVVTSIGEVVGNADAAVRAAYEQLGAGDPAAADDVFAQACFDAGWEG